ncbi:MAG: hypothetical protein U9P10_14245 [Thermodesulfobacteriota bacterium]|nr:hypothetical protein [Thermodesulfobacteriota bacterium]
MAGHHQNERHYGTGTNTQEKGSNQNAASPSHIGESFHNPYTFIPFPDKVDRYLPTALTADELPHEKHRRSVYWIWKLKPFLP